MIKALSQVTISVVLSVAVILGLVHSVPKAQVAPIKQLNISDMRAFTWQMFTDQGTCSGAMIAPNKYLTNAHCYGENMQVDGKTAVVIKKDEDKDLMLLLVDKECPCVPVATSDLPIDTPIYVIGFPLGISEYITEGRLQNFAPFPYNHLRLVSAPIIFGNSGGPVVAVVDGKYQLVGTATAVLVIGGFLPVPHLGVVTTTKAVNDFLDTFYVHGAR
jgi:S1-C subfamily serine protease